MPVSLTNSSLIYNTLKECDIRLLSALPETWLVQLIRLADEDPKMVGAFGEGGGRRWYFGRSTLCRSQIGHVDAEPWISGIH